MMNFEWDEDKRLSNIAKHGVIFEKAIEIFLDEKRLIIPDNRFDYGENRFISIGEIQTRVHVVIYIEKIGNTIRIISARKANKREVEHYEKS